MQKNLKKAIMKQTHKEEHKEYKKKYYEDNKTEFQAYREAHKAEAKAYREAHKAEAKAYREAHKAEIKAYREPHQKQKYYCCENISQIENYEEAKADNFVNWDIHHKLETNNSDGERRLVDLTADELKALGMYYNRPASELIFMKHKEHVSLHKKGKKK